MEYQVTETFDPYALVAEFIDAFEANPPWFKLVEEELEEVLEAMAKDIESTTVQSLANVLKETIDLQYVMCGVVINASRQENPEDISPALLGGYLEVSAAVAEFVDGKTLQEVFRRVHQSNMSKLGEDGKPVRREDGKILKGPNYQPVDLTDIAYRLHLALGREEEV